MTQRIILLNGTSSAGKTTIARALQRTLEPRWIYIGIDLFIWMLTDEAPASGPEPDGADRGRWLLAEGWYGAIAGIAGSGFDVIVDDVICEPDRLEAALRLLAPFQVTFVGVRCPLEIAAQREKDRRDREIGLAARQFGLVHADRSYDCEVDTSIQSPEDCVAAIQRAVEGGRLRAFELMAPTTGG